jgi:hypothetical protein
MMSWTLISNKITIPIIATVLSGILILFTVDELGLTRYVGFKQSLVIFSHTILSQLQKFDFLFEPEWWSQAGNYRIVQLIVLSAILVAGVITLAITDRQISRMTRPRT